MSALLLISELADGGGNDSPVSFSARPCVSCVPNVNTSQGTRSIFHARSRAEAHPPLHIPKCACSVSHAHYPRRSAGAVRTISHPPVTRFSRKPFPPTMGLIERTPHTWTRPPSFPLGKQCSSCQRTRCGDGGLHHILCPFLTFPPWNSFVKSSCTDGRLHHSIRADASAFHIEKASRDNPLHSSWLPRHPSFQSRISSCCGTGSACIANG